MLPDDINASLENEFSTDVEMLVSGKHNHPHRLLGFHDYFRGEKVIRIWRPQAEKVYLEVKGEIVEAKRVRNTGLFEYCVSDALTATDYRIYHHNGLLAHDPYAFLPTSGETDRYLFNKGVHYELYRVMGGRVITQQGVQGVRFTVWAPNALAVSLISDFNYWDGRVNPLRNLGDSGLWEIFIPGMTEGEKYKFEIKSKTGDLLVKSDPYAYQFEMRPKTASIVSNPSKYQWNDSEWMQKRLDKAHDPQPINVYEVHLGSWKKNNGEFLNYRKLAIELAAYCKEMGYTHIELLPVMEHPLDESWGYQVTGYFAPTSRFGTPEDFQWFVDHMHQNEIAVILDWVPGHFPSDDFALARFDGTSLYEHKDPKQGYHPHWNTYIFNFGRNEVTNFLIASGLFWLDMMHIDGLRVDAVASMIYLDYGRKEGEWVPNKYGGRENLDAIEFLKHFNSVAHQKFPGVMVIAEESTAFTGISHPLGQGGLGFEMKWNMGWMHDTLRYFSKDMLYRHYHHNDLTFGILYAFSERFMLVLSHDEVVHEKKSLISKMPGDIWQKFANLRLLFSYMMCQPGKKLLFMGGEIGQWNEWNSLSEIEWGLLEYPTHQGLQRMCKELNHFYQGHPALWEHDFDYNGFEWVDFSDRQNSVISYLRKGKNETLLCIHHFTQSEHVDYHIKLPHVRSIKHLFNSDDEKFGGSGKEIPAPIVTGNGITLVIPTLSTMIFQIEY